MKLQKTSLIKNITFTHEIVLVILLTLVIIKCTSPLSNSIPIDFKTNHSVKVFLKKGKYQLYEEKGNNFNFMDNTSLTFKNDTLLKISQISDKCNISGETIIIVKNNKEYVRHKSITILKSQEYWINPNKITRYKKFLLDKN